MISKLALSFVASLVLSAPALALATTKPVHKAPLKSVARKSAKAAAPVAAAIPDADAEQLEAFKLAYMGHYDCELKQFIDIEPHPNKAGYVDVRWDKSVFTMKPVRSSTGALRLEDVAGRALMIQIANKSMLLDVKIGQRLVDDCVSPAQREFMAALAAQRVAEAASGVQQADTGLGLSSK